jgi:hypothetical protein
MFLFILFAGFIPLFRLPLDTWTYESVLIGDKASETARILRH